MDYVDSWVAWVRVYVGAWVAWVAWVHNILAWVSWVALVEILAWVVWVVWVKKNEVRQKNGMGLNVLLFNHTL